MRAIALTLATLVAFAMPRFAGATESAESGVAGEAEAGRAAVERFGCARCHAVSGFAPDSETGCVACHQRVAGRPRSGLRRTGVATHFVALPDLRHVTARLRTDYLVAFLVDPHDVRPHLEESMPRMPISLTEARAIVAFLSVAGGRAATPTAAPPPDPGNVERGRRVFAFAGCPSCHVFGNVDFATATGATPEFYRAMRSNVAVLLAPNLRFVRDRMDPGVALAWIRDPASVDPDAHMPRPTLSLEDARAVRDFLFLADPGPAVAPVPALATSDVEILSRPVRFADVRAIFGRSCIHCHAKTAGMTATGGLGFRPTGLDLATYDGVRAGASGPDGTRRSVLVTTDGGSPPLLARLLLRHEEAARDVVAPYRDPLTPAVRSGRPGAAPGMPLGLPPLSLGDLRTVATWIAQGAPR